MYNFGILNTNHQMSRLKTFLLFFIISIVANAQEVKKIPSEIPDTIMEQDTAVLLNEVVVTNTKMTPEEQERVKFLILQRRVFKTYPFAKAAAERLTELNKNLVQMTSGRDKRRYIKIVEKYITDEFEPQLKKLSRKDGQILVKLMSRQTGISTFDLIKDLKSGWKAFWSNNTARLFDINLKTEYNPYEVYEDYQIEGILLTAYNNARLVKQDPAKKIDYTRLSNTWKAHKETPKEE